MRSFAQDQKAYEKILKIICLPNFSHVHLSYGIRKGGEIGRKIKDIIRNKV
jgi:hypothetical protein